MKQILLSGILCLTLCSFATAQNANLAVSQQLLPIVESAIATHSLQDYCGTYKMADNEYVDKVNIVLKDGHLATKSPEGEEIILEQLDDNIFFIEAYQLRVLFINENDVVKGVKVIIQGKEIKGEKL
jgi:hypothetical protein